MEYTKPNYFVLDKFSTFYLENNDNNNSNDNNDNTDGVSKILFDNNNDDEGFITLRPKPLFKKKKTLHIPSKIVSANSNIVGSTSYSEDIRYSTIADPSSILSMDMDKCNMLYILEKNTKKI